MFNTPGIIIQGLSVLDLVKSIRRITKKTQAKTLSKLEEILPNENYMEVRKIILDATNEQSREIVKVVFGDIDV